MPVPHLPPSVHDTSLAVRGRRSARVWCIGGLLLPALSWAAEPPDPVSMSLAQLMDVPVLAASKYLQAQTDVAAAVSVITREDIRAFGWRTLAEALASLPGIHISEDRQYTYVGTRGLGLPEDYSARLLITLNGLRLNEPVYDSQTAGREFPVDLALIERIEVIPGPGGAVYGQNALFGVVNLVTREGGDVGGVELAVEALRPQRGQSLRVSLGRRLEDGGQLLLSGSSFRARGEDRYYDYGAGGAGVAAGLDGERDAELFLRLSRERWSFDLSHGDRRKNDPTASYNVDPLVPGNHIRDRFLQTQLQYEAPMGEGSRLMARLSATEYRYGNGAIYSGEHYWYTSAGSSRGLELRWLHTAHPDHKLMLGLEWQSLPRQDQTAEYPADPSQNAYYLTRGWRAGVFGQDEWRMSDQLTATLGLRADSGTVNGTRLSPRAGLIWKPDPVSAYKFLYGRAFRSPSAYERNWSADGETYPAILPAGNPERMDTLEIVADRRLSERLSMRASFYHWYLKERVQVQWDDTGTYWEAFSGPPVRSTGLELSAEHRGEHGLHVRGSLSLQDTRSGGSRLVNAPGWLFKLHARAPLAAGWQAGLEFLAEGDRLGDDGAAYRGPQRVNLNLTSTSLWPGVTVSAGIRNLLDHRDRQPVGADNWAPSVERDGRSLSLKLEASY